MRLGFSLPSVFFKKFVIASGGGGGALPTDPALLLHFQSLFFQT